MKKVNYLFLVLLLSVVWGYGQKLTPAEQPNEAQRLMLERGYGMFIHFGINTFAETEWSDGTLPPETYHPSNLDCDQWIRVARDAGFRYVLFTAKHHEGFALWDSQYTDYDVASSPIKTDVVAEVAKACRKYGLGFALYYSLWDRREPSYKDPDPEKYVDYMCNQLTELLTGYGPVCELWLDGGWDRKPADWNLPRVYNLVKELQPHCAVGVNNTIVADEKKGGYVSLDLMTVDNKYFLQYFPSDFRLADPKIAHKHDKKQYLYQGKSYYLPFEHTICVSKNWSWFGKREPIPTRSLDELEELFYWCTDNDNILVINVPPDQSGRIREHEANTVIALGKKLGLSPDKPLPKNGEFISINAPAQANSVYEGLSEQYGPRMAVDGGMRTRWASGETQTSLTIDLDEKKPFNKVVIFEYQEQGAGNVRVNRIQEYNIAILQNGEWKKIYLGDSPMGDCKVIRFPHSYHASKIQLEVTKASAPPSIWEFNVINGVDQ